MTITCETGVGIFEFSSIADFMQWAELTLKTFRKGGVKVKWIKD